MGEGMLRFTAEDHKASIGWLTPAERRRARKYLYLGHSAERIAELQSVPLVSVKAMKVHGEVHQS